MSEIGSILVAEDDPTDAFFLQRAFAKAGVSISLHFVRDGQEVIDYLRGEPPFADRVEPAAAIAVAEIGRAHV